MIRDGPCELPRSCPTANCSSSTTRCPSLARWYAAAQPITPPPTISTSAVWSLIRAPLSKPQTRDSRHEIRYFRLSPLLSCLCSRFSLVARHTDFGGWGWLGGGSPSKPPPSNSPWLPLDYRQKYQQGIGANA